MKRFRSRRLSKVRFAVSTCLAPALLFGLIVITPAAAQTEGGCAAALPVAPQTVVDAGLGTYTYAAAGVLDPLTQVHMRLSEPHDRVIAGHVSLTSVAFDIPIEDLPHGVALDYTIEALVAGSVCYTGSPTPAFLISHAQPETVETMMGSEARWELNQAATSTFGYALRAAGANVSTASEQMAFCALTFVLASPCDWSPGGAVSVKAGEDDDAVSDLPSTTATPESGFGLSVAAATCKTIRYSNVPADSVFWSWSEFSTVTPSAAAPFTLFEAEARKENTSLNRISLYSQVARSAQGGANVYTRGAVGFDATFPNGFVPATIQPTISFTVRGNGLAAGTDFTGFGDGMARARFQVHGHTENLTTGERLSAGEFYDREAVNSPGLFGGSWQTVDYNTSSPRVVTLPVRTWGPGDHAEWEVKGTNTAEAEAIGSATTSAESDVDEDTPEENQYVQANYIDLTILDANVAWVSGPRCV